MEDSIDNIDRIALKAIVSLETISGMDLVQNRRIILRYSGHFNNYNANVHYTKRVMQFNLSSDWRNIDEDMQIGLMQSLIIKIFKLKNIRTSEMKLYENFMKGLSKYARKHTQDPQLKESFERVNEQMFAGLMEMPNLVFAGESSRKLGSYEYGTDTVYISAIFLSLREEERRFLDYVMYHELLHKKHTFNVKNGRHRAHTAAFRSDERKFPVIEDELNAWLRKKRYSIQKIFRMF